MGQASTINVRTRTVTPPPVAKKEDPNMSTADKQAALNKEIEEENRRKEEANKKQMEEAKKENCKAAQMNKETVTKANAKNKDALIPKYDADIAKYCN